MGGANSVTVAIDAKCDTVETADKKLAQAVEATKSSKAAALAFVTQLSSDGDSAKAQQQREKATAILNALFSQNFLKQVSQLVSLDLSGISATGVKIGNFFCYCCANLKSVTLCSGIVEVGDGFLFECGIEEIDLRPLCNITKIPQFFVSDCEQLRVVDMSCAFPNLEEIDSRFFYSSANLEIVKLAPNSFCAVKKISHKFLHHCSSLRRIDLSSLRNCTVLGNEFVAECNQLEQIEIAGCCQVAEIGVNFFYKCESVASLDLSNFSRCASIGRTFLCGCTALNSLDMSGFVSLREIPDYFAVDARSLKSVTFGSKPLPLCTKIGIYFASECSSLQSVDLSALINVVEHGDEFDWCMNRSQKYLNRVLLPDAIHFALPPDHRARKLDRWRLIRTVLLIREKSRGHIGEAFRIWNVMRFVAQFLC